MSELKKIFTDNVIEHYKNNKQLITFELLKQLRSYGNEGKQIALDILDTEKTDDNYYIDAYGEKISFLGDRNLKKAFTKMNLSQIHINEIEKCSKDLDYFRENYIKIRTKKGYNFPEMRDYQKEYLEVINSDYESIVAMLPRQAGKSVITGIYLAWQTNFNHDMNIGICANKGLLAREFLNNVKEMLYSLPMWMRQGITIWNKSYIETELKMRVLTDVPSSNSFRGFSINLLILDECAWIPSPKYYEMLDGMGPSQSALSWKKNIFLSTPNGMNHFYELVKNARERKKITLYNKNEIKNIKDKILETKKINNEYIVTIDKPQNGYGLFETDWKNIPRYDKKGELIPPEEFKQQIIEKNGLVYFQQNFACSFIGSSYTLINPDILKLMKSKDPVLKWDNRLNVYKEPIKNHKYIMSVDPAKGGLDAFAVQIVDVTKFPWEQSASAQLFKCNYQLMPEFLNEWGNRYNNAFMIIENNEGAGTFIANMINLEFEYSNLYFDKVYNNKFIQGKQLKEPGFRTTSKSRKQILETFKHFVDNNRLIINDKETIKELYSFIIKDNKYQADDGYHDDLIMSLALIFAPFISSRNFEDMKDLVKKLYSEDDISDTIFTDYLAIGNFDITSDYEYFDNLAGKKFDDEFEYSTDYYSKINF